MGDSKEMIETFLARALTYKFLRKNFITVCLFSSVFIFLLLVTSGEWAKNDDYVDLGLYRFGNWNYSDAFSALMPANAGAGRPLHVIWQSVIFPKIDSVGDLSRIRVIHSLIFSLLTVYLYQTIQNIFHQPSVAMSISLIPLILPGSWGLISYTSAAPFAIAIIVCTFGYRTQRLRTFHKWNQRLMSYTIFFLIGLFSVFLYQPTVFFLPLLPAIDYIKSRFDHEAVFSSLKQRMENVIAVVLTSSICLLINYVFVISFYDSPRAEGQIGTLNHLTFVLNSAVDRVIAPNLLRLPIIGQYTNQLAIFIVVFTAGTYFQSIRNSKNDAISKYKYRFLFKATDFLLMFSLLPMFLGFLFFIPEEATDFRRYYFASIASSIILISLSAATANRWFVKRKIVRCFLPIITAVLVVIGAIQFRSSTIEVASKEWRAAVCSSRMTRPPADSTFNFNDIEFSFYQKINGPGDEFNVLSLFRPVAGQMLIWNSYNLNSNQPLILNPWEIKIIISPNPSSEWSSNFLKCYSK